MLSVFGLECGIIWCKDLEFEYNMAEKQARLCSRQLMSQDRLTRREEKLLRCSCYPKIYMLIYVVIICLLFPGHTCITSTFRPLQPGPDRVSAALEATSKAPTNWAFSVNCRAWFTVDVIWSGSDDKSSIFVTTQNSVPTKKSMIHPIQKHLRQIQNNLISFTQNPCQTSPLVTLRSVPKTVSTSSPERVWFHGRKQHGIRRQQQRAKMLRPYHKLSCLIGSWFTPDPGCKTVFHQVPES